MSNTPFKITNIGSDTLQIAVEKIGEPNQNTFFYKKSINTEWIEYENEESISIEPEEYIEISGQANNLSIDEYNFYQFSISGSDAKLQGNINSLINYTEQLQPFTFCKLFYELNAISDISELEFPSLQLAEACYDSMFRKCHGITTPPALPATGLAKRCYAAMFMQCTSLTATPQLPATQLAQKCYTQMFEQCQSLITVSQLPAIDLTSGCYNWMFGGCISLTATPQLPATGMAFECYNGMFNGCTSLTSAPYLPATSLAEGCYRWMFRQCSSLIIAPELAAENMEAHCYKEMFNSCSSLNSIRVSFTKWNVSNFTTSWVTNVSPTGTFYKYKTLPTEYSVSQIPEGWTVVDIPYPLTFTSIGQNTISFNRTGTPRYVNLKYQKNDDVWQEYSLNTKITLENQDVIKFKGINKSFSENVKSNFYYFSTKNSKGNLTVSGSIFSLTNSFDLTSDYQFARLFEETNIENIDNLDISTSSLTKGCYARMFADCDELFEVPSTLLSTAEIMKQNCYESMFEGCNNLTNMPILSSQHLAPACYKKMFKNCDALDIVPDLPASSLAKDCYKQMFYGCSRINSISVGFDNWNNYGATLNWLVNTKDCIIFVKNKKLTQKYGHNNIPEKGFIVIQQ